MPAGNDNKVNGLEASLVKSISNQPNVVGNPNGDSLMGLEGLNKQLASSSADEQAKAEEEFKKSMYGAAADGSSSDEEGASKIKRIHIKIRDKPVSSSTVDVNKIKEATRQFKLGEGLPPPMKTRSNSGSQDLGQILSLPPATTGVASAAVSTPVDLFGTDASTQPELISQPTTGAGGGVATGPIPEDFFQNTISSVHVAASLPPAGTFLSKFTPGVQISNTTPNQVSAAHADSGLQGGVSTQAIQQPVVPIESIGLPDGGVPPQSMSQAVVTPQSQLQPAQPQISSQPLDLSVLGVPNSADSGRLPQTGSAPVSVHPGQV
ncbi:vascular protein [Trifolium medium]|uniref:Vascular protein n=1 Tax=Trifolium medium TaxID=97028 RepID=A0A392NJ97_9FABA|nr:vascular protein [Trifolium medium]